MAYELIRFTLADPLLEKLKSLKSEDEQSIHITAKRLLCGVLKGQQTRESLIDENAFKELQERIEAIEVAIEAEQPPDRSRELGELMERLKAIDKRVENLEGLRDYLFESDMDDPESPDPREVIETRQAALARELEDVRKRLTAIESRGSSRAIFPGDQPITDHGQWVICLTIDDKPVKYWTGSEWSEEISIANRYQSEISLKRTLEKLKTRKRDDPTALIRYNTIANLERILENEK